jgi:hypothetical protein
VPKHDACVSYHFKSDFERVYVRGTEFLECFELCEAEEIGCVHDYISRRLDQVENESVENFVNGRRKWIPEVPEMEALASLGAPFASKFLQSSSKTQMDLVDKYGVTLCFDFGEALELSCIPDGISVVEGIPSPPK